ncbi:hypothetical protein OHA37_17800 [Streptomyces sp. NBC_00335]|uniref:hypothetical protein n=1 Tax=unclassified Streptomyces TaxID=2593676 RepID=UPI00224DFA40|nr:MULTISPECIES: hypothetical protein [unclassified Streptomyces]MCX5405735.1 hypothetical protein [Streptomyces sp. NBC_00086]
MRTKPTMYKRMLRSALAVVFSAVAVFGAISAATGDADSVRAASGSNPASVQAGNTDIGWDSMPMGDIGWDSAPTDIGWDSTPARVS